MRRGPQGIFKYLAIALALSIIFSISYLFVLYNPRTVWLEFSTVKLVKIISNKDGRIHKLLPELNGPLNHAYKKMATSSKVYASGGIHGGFRATDGNLHGTLFHSEYLEEPYVDIDLNRAINIKHIRLWNREIEFASRIIPFKIFLGLTPFKEDGSISNSERNAVIFQQFTDVQLNYSWILEEPVAARYVRVQLEAEGYLHFYELQVYDTIVREDYLFTPNYVQYRAEPPIVPLPDTFHALLSLGGHLLNITKPTRIFMNNGTEITGENYGTLFSQQYIYSEFPDVYISDGSNFVGEMRVCMVFLCTDGMGFNTNADYISEVISNLEVLSANYFTVYQYDVIIFYYWTDPTHFEINKARLNTAFPYLRVRFVDASRHFPPTLPQRLIDNNVDMTLYLNGSDCAPGNHWRLNYLHMGRFWSTQLWLEPIFEEYDLIWRLDADATIDVPIKASEVNFLRDMWGKGGLFAYWHNFKDQPNCDNGIVEAVNTFAKRKGLTFKQKKKPDNTAYWGGFGVYATKFFCKNPDWLEFADYLDSLGGHYNHRWGEQNVFPYSLSLFLEPGQMYWVSKKYLNIFHDHVRHRNEQ